MLLDVPALLKHLLALCSSNPLITLFCFPHFISSHWVLDWKAQKIMHLHDPIYKPCMIFHDFQLFDIRGRNVDTQTIWELEIVLIAPAGKV